MMGSPPSRFERRQRIRREAGLRGRCSRPEVLHHLAALLALASRARASAKVDNLGRQQRHQRQQLALAQRLLDPLPDALRGGGRAAELFWRAVRFGGAGILMAWWLMR